MPSHPQEEEQKKAQVLVADPALTSPSIETSKGSRAVNTQEALYFENGYFFGLQAAAGNRQYRQ
jgi:hypothetical protein